ncbi:unnamed protein product [Clonostachys rosea f. rosea IK726]|uniref:Uncharacterized protein n=1 Tax=Clonostachys rosea f. rosea IK726 TaxID=1349383 RepID=A0ACA9U9C4_BIOOC|nr:unnamed protein product [Clonostachys rosea f. rosea IK726]
MSAPPEKPVQVSQAFDAHAPIVKSPAVRASSEANTRPFTASVTRSFESEDAASTTPVSATQATSTRAVLIEEPRNNRIILTHRKTYGFAPISAAAPGVVTSAVVVILWIRGYIYEFESEFDTDYTSSPNSSSTSSLSLSSTGSSHNTSSGTSSISDSGSSSSSGLNTDSSRSSESETDDSSSSGQSLSNWEVSDNGFDTDTDTSDIEEDVGSSDSADEVLTPLGADTQQGTGGLDFVTWAGVCRCQYTNGK